MKRSLKKILSFSAAVGLVHLNNLYIIGRSRKGLLSQEAGKCYNWSYANIFYKTHCNGHPPMLLIHDASEFGSSVEWTSVIPELMSSYDLYIIELPGCGRSDKPAITYTNYFMAQMIRDFIRDVIGKETIVCASGLSASFALAATCLEGSLIREIRMIDPCSLNKLQKVPGEGAVIGRFLLHVPVLGTTIYHFCTARNNIEFLLKEKCFYNPFQVPSELLDGAYEAAHLGKGGGKHLLASLNGYFLYWDIRHILSKNTVPITILYGENSAHGKKISHQYRRCCKLVRSYAIPESKRLPQIENPKEVCRILRRAR